MDRIDKQWEIRQKLQPTVGDPKVAQREHDATKLSPNLDYNTKSEGIKSSMQRSCVSRPCSRPQ